MDSIIFGAIEKLNISHRRRNRWRRVLSWLSAITVFCTTYALILPAITMDRDSGALCGMVSHVHGEECYEETVSFCYSCVEEIHTHSRSCYDGIGGCLCGYADYVIHTHDISCYDENGALICPLPEIGEHFHDESCYQSVTEEVRDEGHTHSEACYEERRTLICEISDGEHVHGEKCYLTESVLVCTEEEREPGFKTVFRQELVCPYEQAFYHTHIESCFDENGVLVCGLTAVTEAAYHKHTPECFENGALICGRTEILRHEHTDCLCEKRESVIVCTLPEHEHDMACFMDDLAGDDMGYVCGFAYEHIHSEGCFMEGEFICTLSEHVHTELCLMDHTADLETSDDWDDSVGEAMMSDVWSEDIVAIAETQIGYRESEINFVLEDGERKGITRYGQWYGDPYGNWSGMFCAFCVSEAGIRWKVPNASCTDWEFNVRGSDLYKLPYEEGPSRGDLVFFDTDYDGFADSMGVVNEVYPDCFTAIEGDSNDEVRVNTHFIWERELLSFCSVPEEPGTLTLMADLGAGPVGDPGPTFGGGTSGPQIDVITAEEAANDWQAVRGRYMGNIDTDSKIATDSAGNMFRMGKTLVLTGTENEFYVYLDLEPVYTHDWRAMLIAGGMLVNSANNQGTIKDAGFSQDMTIEVTDILTADREDTYLLSAREGESLLTLITCDREDEELRLLVTGTLVEIE